ncbi:hypothetical protein LBMAG52_37490 [Planctomycetia bacterium]|nr:hypothetical protein LBMAG52_37490 [Planctomycetia bacterium]
MSKSRLTQKRFNEASQFGDITQILGSSMLYRLYSSVGNSVGVDPYLGYSEIGDDGYWSRYIEFLPDGLVLKYTETHDADSLGQLPEGLWDEAEALKDEYGVVAPITVELFELVWARTRCDNDHLAGQ